MRRNLIRVLFPLLTIIFLLGGCSATEQSNFDAAPVQSSQVTIPEQYTRAEVISSPDQALQLLSEGNNRFSSGSILPKDMSSARRTELAINGQHPFAVIVSCSDSRVSPEDLFDQALGDLFVVRVAGNVITPVELGSVEYAVEHLNVPLVMVLGHEKCGAVTAAVEGGELTGSIAVIADKIQPAIEQVRDNTLTQDALIEESSRLNVLNALKDIRQSLIIQHALGENLKLYGGMYGLETGQIQWIDAQ